MSPIRTLAYLGLLVVFAAHAQGLHPSVEDGHYRLSLAWLQGSSTPIELRGARGARRLAIPVSPRYALEAAHLELTYTRSLALNRRSQLAVSVNGRIYAQLPLAGEGTEQLARISLPERALRAGYPELELRAAQHYTDDCEDPDAPELYTQIDAEDSALLIKASRRPLAPSLARLDEIFDRRLWLRQYPLELFLPSTRATPALLDAAAVTVQAVAAKLQYLPMRVQVSHLARPTAASAAGARFPALRLQQGGWDAVVLGTREMLTPHLHPSLTAQIRSPYLGLFPSDQDPTRYILVVSGRTVNEVMHAARALNLDASLPDAPEVALREVKLPPFARIEPSATQRQRFDQLGQPTASFQRTPFAHMAIKFWALRDWLDPAAPYVELTLNYAYGAGLDQRSALNVILNGQFVQALRLDDPAGAQVRGARVRLPAIALRDGLNELRLEASLHGLDPGGACTQRFYDHLRLTIYQDSYIELPPLTGRVRFPDLAILASTALPYADLRQTQRLYLTDASAATLSATLSWVGKLRQVARAPLPTIELRLSNADEPIAAAATWIGPTNSLPAHIKTQAPHFMPSVRWQQVALGEAETVELAGGFWSWLRRPFQPYLEEARTRKPAHASIRLDPAEVAGGALIQYLDADDRPLTVLTADSAARLQAGVQRLIEHDVWNSLRGGAMAWNAQGEPFAWGAAVDTSILGELPLRLRLSQALSERPWLLIALVLVLIGLLVWIGGRLLRRLALRRMRRG